MNEQAAGTTAETPFYFKWVRDDDGQVNWGRIMLMLGVTVLTAYLSVQTQRTASDPDLVRTFRMKVAQKQITAGVKLQRIGKSVEDAGWATYEKVRQ